MMGEVGVDLLEERMMDSGGAKLSGKLEASAGEETEQNW